MALPQYYHVKLRLINADTNAVLAEYPLNYATDKNTLCDWRQFSVTLNTSAENLKIQLVSTHHGLTATSLEMRFNGMELLTYEPFVMLTKQGFFAYQSPSNYFKVGPNVFELKGSRMEVDSMIVKNNLVVYGQTFSAADNLAGTTSDIFTVGTATTGGPTTYRFGDYSTTNQLVSDGLAIESSVNLKAPALLANNVAVATTHDMDLEFMKTNFQQVSWAQFAIWDAFDSSAKRDPGTPGDAVIYLNQLYNGNDATINKAFTFYSKTYSGITTVYSGTSSSVGPSYLTDSTKTWFTDEVKNLTLVDSSAATFNVISNTATTVTVSGTPASGAYSLVDTDPQYVFAYMSYSDSTNGGTGYIKYEFSPTGDFSTPGVTSLVIYDSSVAINRLGGIIKLSTFGITTGHNYKVKITITNNSSGYGAKVHRFLVSTDPSPWRF